MNKPRKIVVTGASSGIGAATARFLVEHGDTVIGISRRAPAFEHSLLEPYSIDLASRDASTQLDAIAKQHNTIGGVISIAGAGHFGSLENFSPKQIQESITQNLLSHMFVARAFVPLLKKQPHSNMIFMGSEAALSGARQGSLYCAAKFGLRGFSQSLREEGVSSSLHVGIINPGLVRSEFFEQLNFQPGEKENNAIDVCDVVDAIALMLNSRGNAVIDEINLSPLKNVVTRQPSN